MTVVVSGMNSFPKPSPRTPPALEHQKILYCVNQTLMSPPRAEL
jgi:hypothetical protein